MKNQNSAFAVCDMRFSEQVVPENEEWKNKWNGLSFIVDENRNKYPADI